MHFVSGALGWLALAASTGCASSTAPRVTDELSAKVDALQTQLVRQDARLEDLANQVLVLSHRVAPGHAEGPAPEAVPRLEVVKLVPQESSGEEQTEDTLGVIKVPPPSASIDREADALYRAALRKFQQGDTQAALASFQGFAERYGAHRDHAHALYWAGECYFELGDFSSAVRWLGRVPAEYPRSDKVPDALFRLGLAYERLGERAQALWTFELLVAKHRSSPAADLARARLASSESPRRSP